MTRLVHLADYTHERAGSFVPAIHDVLRAAVARGWEAELVLPRPAGAEPPWVAGIRASGIGVRFTEVASGYRERTEWIGTLLDEQPGEDTILHTHFTTFDVPAALAANERRWAKTIWHEHTALSQSPKVVARNVFKFGFVGQSVAAILCPAPDLATAVRRRLGPRTRVTFIPNAIDAGRFMPAEESDRLAARAELGIDPGATVLLSFAWHWQVKGGDIFVDALRRICAGRPELTGVAVTEESHATEQQGDADLGGQLRLLAPRADVGGLYAAADLFVAPSRAEGGTPFSVLESIASGLPVVASRIPGHTFICDGLASCLTVAPDPVPIAAAIEDMTSRPPSPEQLREARDRIVADFDLALWSGRLIDIYLGLFE